MPHFNTYTCGYLSTPFFRLIISRIVISSMNKKGDAACNSTKLQECKMRCIRRTTPTVSTLMDIPYIYTSTYELLYNYIYTSTGVYRTLHDATKQRLPNVQEAAVPKTISYLLFLVLVVFLHLHLSTSKGKYVYLLLSQLPFWNPLQLACPDTYGQEQSGSEACSLILWKSTSLVAPWGPYRPITLVSLSRNYTRRRKASLPNK